MDIIETPAGRRVYKYLLPEWRKKHPNLPDEPYFDGSKWTLGPNAWNQPK